MNTDYWNYLRIQREPERALRSMEHDPLESEILSLPWPRPPARIEIQRLVRLSPVGRSMSWATETINRLDLAICIVALLAIIAVARWAP